MIDTTGLKPFDAVALQLRPIGLKLSVVSGGFEVNYKNGTADTAFITDDLREALQHGLSMPTAPMQEPPLGPMGKRNTKRAKMYAHNRKLAARRYAAQAKSRAAEPVDQPDR